ncbi:MAG: hypothetical protein OXE95_05555 [Chloroflexi bacterium]|nr:hypothetical protein [Chloroflexota bacterium]MCY4247028.1 hypothetical protein [Chloroflexota bacterium]
MLDDEFIADGEAVKLVEQVGEGDSVWLDARADGASLEIVARPPKAA